MVSQDSNELKRDKVNRLGFKHTLMVERCCKVKRGLLGKMYRFQGDRIAEFILEDGMRWRRRTVAMMWSRRVVFTVDNDLCLKRY